MAFRQRVSKVIHCFSNFLFDIHGIDAHGGVKYTNFAACDNTCTIQACANYWNGGRERRGEVWWGEGGGMWGRGEGEVWGGGGGGEGEGMGGGGREGKEGVKEGEEVWEGRVVVVVVGGGGGGGRRGGIGGGGGMGERGKEEGRGGGGRMERGSNDFRGIFKLGGGEGEVSNKQAINKSMCAICAAA